MGASANRAHAAPAAPPGPIQAKQRAAVVAAALLALFLGALDTLIMGAAMPTVVADLGGLDLYSWVFSAYLLSRAVSLPIFGKLADLYDSKHLFGCAIAAFLTGSLLAGLSVSMVQLILSRALQGIGAGAVFALVYILLADIAPADRRGKMMSSASLVWGLASVLGPPLGGFIVDFWSWRWIFFINIPLGILSVIGIYLYFRETRPKRRSFSIDFLGSAALVITVLPLLGLFLVGGHRQAWVSPPTIGLAILAVAGGALFYRAEKRARDPILPVGFLKVAGFRWGGGAAFFSSFAIFSLAAFSPLFIQGALGQSPSVLGLAMIPLSLAWSAGALICGQAIHRFKKKRWAVGGGLLLAAGSVLTLGVSSTTPVAHFSLVLAVAGLGMGSVSVSSLLIVQDSLADEHLGVATAAHQFARTLGGTVGVGISGSLLNAHFFDQLSASGLAGRIPAELSGKIAERIDNLFDPAVSSALPPDLLQALHGAVGQGVLMAFGAAAAAAVVGLVFCLLLPGHGTRSRSAT